MIDAIEAHRWSWPVRIKSLRGNKVRLEQPLPLAARLAFQPRSTTFGPVITGSGVEGITIEVVKTVRPKHLLDKG